MSNEITTLGDALNYLGIIGGLVVSMVACVYVLARVGESWARRRCRYRHPASVGRRARIVAQRRAQLDGRGVIK
jgi:hypothetical protein